MNNDQLLKELNEALKDYINYSKGIDILDKYHESIMDRGFCFYFYRKGDLHKVYEQPNMFANMYLTRFLEKDHTLLYTGHWYPIGLKGSFRRIELLTKAIEYYTNNPITTK